MFGPIVDAIKGEFADKAQSILGLEEAQVEPTLKCVSDSLVDTVKKQVFGGKLNDVIGLLTGATPADANNPLMTELSSGLVNSLSTQMGMGASQAQQITDFSVPFAIEKITKKFIASGNTADLDGFASFIGIDKNILKSVSGGIGGFFGNMFGR
ncbi:hypothetical protein [Solitalea koreensis]|uniref:DUF937 domain-containing protein n=1 Tax=Solitalea koreensis TaxID=543615 RepID=A0A521B2A9_9SPHI|nr:hypothetical protein [Solitalea koreensis]SMO41223.1 hypothetical protein SAMN06265350_101625 [Solitalea koreensis]